MSKMTEVPEQTLRRLSNITASERPVDPVRIGPFTKAIEAPFWGGFHSSRPTDPLTRALVSDFDELVSNIQPDRIVHGDVHCSFDHHPGQSRIICNAQGYDRDDLRFHGALLVEIGP